METVFPPHRAQQDQPAPRRRRPGRFVLFNSRDAQDMASLLISAIAGALTTGALATLIMMSAPAHAGTAGANGPDSAAHKTVSADRLYPARAVPGDDPAPIPFTGPRGLDLPPVCTCVLPQATPN